MMLSGKRLQTLPPGNLKLLLRTDSTNIIARRAKLIMESQTLEEIRPGLVHKILQLPVLGPIFRHRFIKFGIVGFSGTVLNLFILYTGQEFLFVNILQPQLRLHLSLSGAIFLATIHNYLFNRTWTWGDRKGKTRYGFFIQAGQYFLACGIAIAAQYSITILFAHFIHYLIANISGIVISAVVNYLLNDIWTFAVVFREKPDKQVPFISLDG